MILGAARSSVRQGIRAFDPGRDLGAVADLIEVAFRGDLGAVDLEVIQGIRSAASLGPLITIVAAVFPALRQALQGFVWVEDGKVVGNVSWGPVPGVEGYVISNVAVHPEHRRRGIARRLMERALEELESAGGSLVSLEVGRDNVAAQHLYRSLGFETVGARTELRWRGAAAPEVAAGVPDVVPFSEDRWEEYEVLVASAVSEPERELGAPEEVRIRPGSAGRLLAAMGWRRFAGWAVRGAEELEAVVTVRTDPLAGRTRLVMIVKPEARGRVELALLERATSALPAAGGASARAVLYPSYEEGVALLRAAGFDPIRTLDRMMKKLGGRRG